MNKRICPLTSKECSAQCGFYCADRNKCSLEAIANNLDNLEGDLDRIADTLVSMDADLEAIPQNR